MMEKFRGFGIVGMMFLLMVSIVSASVLDYYGKVTSMAEVVGTVFYAAPDYNLLINEEPSSHTHNIKITDGGKKIFWTSENLGGINFNYIPKLNLYVRANVNDIVPPKPLVLSFGYSDTNNIRHEICNAVVYVDVSSDFGKYNTICEGSSILQSVDYFYYDVIGGGYKDIEYGISTQNTKVEVSKV